MGYDTPYGRASTHTYPSGLVVQTQYGAYGHPGAIANATTGQIYWEATAMDAWDKVTAESFVDGTTGTHLSYQSTGQENTASWMLKGSTVDSLSYAYDSFGNLTRQNRAAGSSSNTETYLYDPLQRLTTATRWVGGAASYGYDSNGNVISGAVQESYDANNQARTITRGGTVTFSYGSTGARYREVSSTETTVFGSDGYERTGAGTSATHRHELGPVVFTVVNGVATPTYMLRDRLGSVLAETDVTGTIVSGGAAKRSYDAFGKVRNGDFTDKSGGTLTLQPVTLRGFTGQEHQDDVQVIHMNGRVFDPNLGRFLSVDPVIQDPTDSQSLNPYSYLRNSPLAGTDPTGYEQCTGSHVEHESCEGPAFSSTQVGTPSVTEMKAARAHAASQSNGAVSMNSQGAGGIKDQQAAASDKGAASNAPTTKPGEQPASQSQDDKNIPELGTVKVRAIAMSAPSRDLGFYLSQKYSPDRPHYHKYGGAGAGDWAMCHPSASAWCTSQHGYDALPRFVYPGQDPSNPVQDGEFNMIYWPDGEEVGHIQTFLEPTTFSIYNVTLPDHAFHDGFVRRQIVTQGDTLYLRTSCEGNNTSEYRRMENVLTWRPGFNMNNENFRTYMIQSWLKEQP